MHPALHKGAVAVITGGASGLGLAAACRAARLGMRVALADLAGERLEAAVHAVIEAGGAPDDVIAIATDVADRASVEGLLATVTARFGVPDFLMNNAGIQPGSSIFDEKGTFERILAVNLGGVIHGSQVFGPAMVAAAGPRLIVNTGSKQGITTPPGDPAYNVAKAGVKAFTEALQHALRNVEGCQVEARLFIPGFVFTPLTASGRVEKPAGAWTPDETIDFLFEALSRDDFYILCPDNDVDRKTDEKRILWAAGDIVENRPPLSRWHPDYADAFADWLRKA